MKLLVILALAVMSLHTAGAAEDCLGREVMQNMTVQVRRTPASHLPTRTVPQLPPLLVSNFREGRRRGGQMKWMGRREDGGGRMEEGGGRREEGGG